MPAQPTITRTSALTWAVPKENLSETERVLSVAAAARTFNFPIANVLSTIISGEHKEYENLKNGFYSRTALPHLLNILASDARGKKGLDDWLEDTGYAQQFIESKIDKEMDNLKKKFFLRTADVTPERISGFVLEKDVSAFIEQLAPTTKAMVFRAAQTDRAIRENTKKDAEIVSYLCKNLHFCDTYMHFCEAVRCNPCANQQCAISDQPIPPARRWVLPLQRRRVKAVD